MRTVIIPLLFFSLSLFAETRVDLPEHEGGHVAVIYSLPAEGSRIAQDGQWVRFEWVNSNPEAPALRALWSNGEKYVTAQGLAVKFRYTHYDEYHCRAVVQFKTRTVSYDFDVTVQAPVPVKAADPRDRQERR